MSVRKWSQSRYGGRKSKIFSQQWTLRQNFPDGSEWKFKFKLQWQMEIWVWDDEHRVSRADIVGKKPGSLPMSIDHASTGMSRWAAERRGSLSQCTATEIWRASWCSERKLKNQLQRRWVRKKEKAATAADGNQILSRHSGDWERKGWANVVVVAFPEVELPLETQRQSHYDVRWEMKMEPLQWMKNKDRAVAVGESQKKNSMQRVKKNWKFVES